ncbi:uncharacterized protein C12orf60 homolog [Acomys russatus]|uniref:uncharacterized protein C12orf60 homolog n=1 Tax=Acomys russatus TaxID=60746 RepID=UPI0021E26967|nr:uncharacterized protein C12orf60 homolog [Acomys russatus]
MSSESEKDKERLIQAAKRLFFHIQDLVSLINRFADMFNLTMKTQILPMELREESCLKDFFEQMIRTFKEMQSMVDEKHKEIQKEPLCSQVVTAVTSAVEKCASMGPYHTAKEVFKNIQTPAVASVLSSGHILGSLESSLSLLMQFPIMGLRLSDFYREDTKEQSEATTSKKNTSPERPKAIAEDALRQLQDAFRTEKGHKSVGAAADELEQCVTTMGPILQVLQKAMKTMEGDISTFREGKGK